MTDKHFRDWESHYLGFGYGTGEAVIIPALKAFFDSLEKPNGAYDHRVLEDTFTPFAAWMLINFLANSGLIEYGTSSRHGWLTARGRVLRDYMATKTADELIDVTDKDEVYVECFPDLCQCDDPCNNPLFARSK